MSMHFPTPLMVRLIKLAFVLAVLLAARVAAADDLLPPPWRGQASTTRQQWTFPNDNKNNVPPNGFNANPNGNASVFISGNASWAGGEWTLNPGTTNPPQDPGEMLFLVPNMRDADHAKLVRVQVTFRSASGNPPDTTVSPSTGTGNFTPTFTSGGVPGPSPGTIVQAQDFTFPTCPASEFIRLRPPTAGGSVNVRQVVIDTICPEPTVGTAALTAAVVLMRRRRIPPR